MMTLEVCQQHSLAKWAEITIDRKQTRPAHEVAAIWNIESQICGITAPSGSHPSVHPQPYAERTWPGELVNNAGYAYGYG